MTDPIRRHVAAVLVANKILVAQREAALREREAAGVRIIDGGQTSTPDEQGRSAGEVRDWRTGQVLESGVGQFEDYVSALDRLDPGQRWVLIDNLRNDDGFPEYPGPTVCRQAW
jgi:hypothetical protein